MFFKKVTKLELIKAKEQADNADKAYLNTYKEQEKLSSKQKVEYEITKAILRKAYLTADRKYERLMAKYKRQNGLN